MLRAERWLVLLIDVSKPETPRVVHLQRTAFAQDQYSTTVRFQLPAQEAGTMCFETRVYCDVYVGLDPESKQVKKFCECLKNPYIFVPLGFAIKCHVFC